LSFVQRQTVCGRANAPRVTPDGEMILPPGDPENDTEMQLLAYRFGSSLKRDEESLAALIVMCEELEGLTHKELAKECRRLQIPLSKQEVEDLFAGWTDTRLPDLCAVMTPEVLTRVLAVSDGAVPDDKVWLRRAVAAAGVIARSSGSGPLSTRLARIGGSSLCAHPVEVRNVFLELEPFDEEATWRRALVALDKKEDGQILIEPLVQWAAGMGVTETVVVDTKQDWLDEEEPNTPNADADLFDFLDMNATERHSLRDLEAELFQPRRSCVSSLPPVQEVDDASDDCGEEDSQGGELWHGGLSEREVQEAMQTSKYLRRMRKSRNA